MEILKKLTIEAIVWNSLTFYYFGETAVPTKNKSCQAKQKQPKADPRKDLLILQSSARNLVKALLSPAEVYMEHYPNDPMPQVTTLLDDANVFLDELDQLAALHKDMIPGGKVSPQMFLSCFDIGNQYACKIDSITASMSGLSEDITDRIQQLSEGNPSK